MALPKYLPVKKKIPYTVRLPEHLLNSLNAYADLTGNTTTNVVIDVLTDFMKDKIVFNDYLRDVSSITYTTCGATLEIKRIPNNLDKFNKCTYISEDGFHKGIEFYVHIPKKERCHTFDCLYCFYFKTSEDIVEIQVFTSS